MTRQINIQDVDASVLESFEKMDDIRSYLICKYWIDVWERVYALIEQKAQEIE